MFIKEIKKSNSPKGKFFLQYLLTENYRIEKKVKQKVVLYLGYNNLLEIKRNRDIVRDLLEMKIQGFDTTTDTSSNIPVELEDLAQIYYKKYISKIEKEHNNNIKKDNSDNSDISKIVENEIKKVETDFAEIDLKTIDVEDCRELGAEYICKEILSRLELKEFLLRKGWNETKANKALLSIISRAVLRASENKSENLLQIRSGLLELFDDIDTISRHELYRSASELYKIKDELEEHLYGKINSLFNVEDTLLIYDLTNTYFEGRKRNSRRAQFGRAKDKRNDCKLVVLGAVISKDGFLKHSRIYDGNMSDPPTLKDIIEQMKGNVSDRQHLVVIDAGIATVENLEMLRQEGYLYVCVSRSNPHKNYTVDLEDTIKIKDKKNNEIELKFMDSEGSKDRWLYVKSGQKELKENSMLEREMKKFEKELENLKNGLNKKGCTKQYGKVYERLGRIKERNRSVHKYYDIKIDSGDGKITTLIEYNRNEKEINEKDSGIYYLRTNYTNLDETGIWEIYNTIREVESTFRCLKTDLKLRPVYHQKDLYSDAHLHLGLLSYHIVSVIRYMLKEAGIHYSWTKIVDVMGKHKSVVITMKSKKNESVIIKKCSKPEKEQLEIYRTLKMSSLPYRRKKFVVFH